MEKGSQQGGKVPSAWLKEWMSTARKDRKRIGTGNLAPKRGSEGEGSHVLDNEERREYDAGGRALHLPLVGGKKKGDASTRREIGDSPEKGCRPCKRLQKKIPPPS